MPEAKDDDSALLTRHRVTVERAEWVPAKWHPLLDEALTRPIALGWHHRRVTQVQEKFGSLRVYLDSDGEAEGFLEQAREVTGDIEERSRRAPDS